MNDELYPNFLLIDKQKSLSLPPLPSSVSTRGIVFGFHGGSAAFIVQTLHGNEFHAIPAAFVAKLTLVLWLRLSSRRSNLARC